MITDFQTKQLFGHYVNMMQPLQFQGVRTKDKKTVTTYIEKLYDHLEAKNAFQLSNQLTTTPNIQNSTNVEMLDDLMGQGGNIADQACK